MSHTPFESPDALKKFVAESSLDEFRATLSHHSSSELAQSFILLQTQPAIEFKKKFEYLLQFINSPAAWETLGKHFSVSHFLNFLEFLDRYPSCENQLNFILVGLHPLVFSQALNLLQEKHLSYLKHESLLEPLQYHLTQFIHEGESLRGQVERKAQEFMQDISSVKVEELTPDNLDGLFNRINDLRNLLLDYLERICTALAIVWHTDRIDLIEKLSAVNESLQHQLSHIIGHRSFDSVSSTGLYFILEKTLSRIFDLTLKDDDAALEGLTRLGVWYLKDYWELGLLPLVHEIEKLEEGTENYNEEKYLSHQQHLLFLAQKQLQRLKIETVGHLKKEYLFSKPLLKRYIEKHHHLLLLE